MAKKTFNLENGFNPAMQFISEPSTEPTEPKAPEPVTEPPEGYKINPIFIEKKTKRLQLLIQPSLYNDIKAKADADKKSVNDTIHRILEEAIRKEQK